MAADPDNLFSNAEVVKTFTSYDELQDYMAKHFVYSVSGRIFAMLPREEAQTATVGKIGVMMRGFALGVRGSEVDLMVLHKVHMCGSIDRYGHLYTDAGLYHPIGNADAWSVYASVYNLETVFGAA